MAIKRYIATSDNTITDAFQVNLQTRGTGSNMGAADTLEAFYIYGQTSQGTGSENQSGEKSRILIQFDVDKINADRAAGLIPASGNISWYINLYNAPHSFTLPKDFKMSILPVSASWQEGRGLDMENYTDQTYEGTGSNWIRRGASGDGLAAWTTTGGDFLEVEQVVSSSGFASYTASFTDGTEDLSVDVSEVVEKWLEGATANYGFGVLMSSSYETGSYSYYTKKFFARSSEYFFLRPNLEARWDSSTKDDSARFTLSSSILTSDDNVNTLYLYNYVYGQLKNIGNQQGSTVSLRLYSGSLDNTVPTGSALKLPAGGNVASDGNTKAIGGPVGVGVYTASLAFNSSSIDTVFPVWAGGDGTTEIHTGSALTVVTHNASNYNPDPDYVTTIDNLKAVYSPSEEARFRLFVRSKNWNPNNYTVMQSELPSEVIEDAYYSLYRIVDDYVVIPYGTGSSTQPQAEGTADSYTRLSYDISGNYFDLDMDLLQAGYEYGLKFAYYSNGSYREQKEVFKFKVEE